MSQLLVSVRSATEALAALVGGADLIDVKEPARGSLGRADPEVVGEIARVVAGRRPISVALGELLDFTLGSWPEALENQLKFFKLGLAGCAGRFPWQESLLNLQQRWPGRLVFVAYADWECAQAPHWAEVAALACQRSNNVLLVDTHCKETSPTGLRRRPTLLDWMTKSDIHQLCRRCQLAKVRVALAGSLGPKEIAELAPAAPDWFAVRGAACGDGDRSAGIDTERVAGLARLIHHLSLPANTLPVPLPSAQEIQEQRPSGKTDHPPLISANS